MLKRFIILYLSLMLFSNMAFSRDTWGNFVRNPFEPISSEDNPLLNYSINGLHLVGILIGEDKQWGIIITPDGKLNAVKKGDLISRQQWRVVNINSNNIVLQKSNSADSAQTLILSLTSVDTHKPAQGG